MHVCLVEQVDYKLGAKIEFSASSLLETILVNVTVFNIFAWCCLVEIP